MTHPTVDLTNYDREPIHIPGLIQPHGVLLVLKVLRPDPALFQTLWKGLTWAGTNRTSGYV